jgi:hypothetical protein
VLPLDTCKIPILQTKVLITGVTIVYITDATKFVLKECNKYNCDTDISIDNDIEERTRAKPGLEKSHIKILNFPPSLKYLDCNQSYYTSVSLKS